MAEQNELMAKKSATTWGMPGMVVEGDHEDKWKRNMGGEGWPNLVAEAAEGDHSKAAVLDLGELVLLEVLLVVALRKIAGVSTEI